MRHSRYLWLLMIIMSCLVVMIAWKTPQAVVSAMAQPQFADTPRVAVQRFWDCLDTRQLEMADQLLLSQDLSPLGEYEVEKWKELVERDPFLSMKKLEFLSSSSQEDIIIRVSWASPLRENLSATYAIKTQSTPEGWKITQIKKITPQSMAIQFN
ncbi:hypothetical protein [Desulfitobacterium metallireducens]|uniref:DUF4829 domain-containing protein n=1 Tax=Desulfitobacterium metallireducens DSM 15288 TaxID=871968 RepID=W0E7A1_9FIRM|nr:hypothetical protein [Desulfitobacterium metallireducens]AHF06725.1 hypothetical protein DESME_06375 [Desulfitobacterium metallireducens DSM 15288]